uniref:Membrane protein n=1 Tax=Carcinus maenas virus 1 TaxID=2704945 RepID=A0A6G9HDL1_9VIRU|nr:membrane protein [Carcinus maenas virus 1]
MMDDDDDLYRQIFKYVNHRNSTFPAMFYTDRYFLIDKKLLNRFRLFNTIKNDSDVIYLYEIDDLYTVVDLHPVTFTEIKKKYNTNNFKRYLNHLHQGTKTCKYLVDHHHSKIRQQRERVVVNNSHVNTVMTFFNYFKFNIPLFNALLLNTVLYDRGLVDRCILKLPKKKSGLFEQVLLLRNAAAAASKKR